MGVERTAREVDTIPPRQPSRDEPRLSQILTTKHAHVQDPHILGSRLGEGFGVSLACRQRNESSARGGIVRAMAQKGGVKRAMGFGGLVVATLTAVVIGISWVFFFFFRERRFVDAKNVARGKQTPHVLVGDEVFTLGTRTRSGIRFFRSSRAQIRLHHGVDDEVSSFGLNFSDLIDGDVVQSNTSDAGIRKRTIVVILVTNDDE